MAMSRLMSMMVVTTAWNRTWRWR